MLQVATATEIGWRRREAARRYLGLHRTPHSCSSYTPLSVDSSKTSKLQREDHQEICRQTPKISTQYLMDFALAWVLQVLLDWFLDISTHRKQNTGFRNRDWTVHPSQQLSADPTSASGWASPTKPYQFAQVLSWAHLPWKRWSCTRAAPKLSLNNKDQDRCFKQASTRQLETEHKVTACHVLAFPLITCQQHTLTKYLQHLELTSFSATHNCCSG